MLTTSFALFVLVHVQHVVICDLRNVTVYNNITQAEVRTQQPAKFVDKLKHILRKDNDDYGDGHKKGVTTKTNTSVTGDEGDPFADQVNDVYRRMMHDRHSRRRHSHRRKDVASNKDMSEDRAKTQKQRSGRQTNMLGEGGVPYVSAGAKLYRFRAAAAAALEADLRRAGADGDDSDAAHLDMAPARGGNIEALKDKGRLCHHHVLVAEGPQGEGRGGVYPRVSPARAPAPAAPHLLLPRCCNCCQKSVLGCE